jgi:SAM-dependent methyltransferase
MTSKCENHPSLENLVESEDLGLEILHPGGLEITRELAELCRIGKDTKVLDVASGTGESVCYLAESFGCQAVGVDASDYLLERAKEKAGQRNLDAEFNKGDAHHLPFDDDVFDAVISECTTCLLDKERALREMVRVANPGGYVGIHDLCWKEGAPEQVKQRLIEIENERPETLEGWKRLFEKVGLIEIRTVDKSHLLPLWTRGAKKMLGITGQLRIFLRVIRKWGLKGLGSVWESERIFQSVHMGYGIIVGRKL